MNGFITFGDTPNLDAFGRLRVSTPHSLFDDMSEYGVNPQKWETRTNGTGTVAFQPNKNAVLLSTGGTGNGAFAIRQTRAYMRYQPGKSQFTLMTFETGGGTGARNRFVRRTNVGGTPVDDIVEQANWSGERMTGVDRGPSLVLDATKTNILWIAMEYLGVGRAQMGFVVDGEFFVCHSFLNTNNMDDVYMSSGCLPLRYEVRNIGSESVMRVGYFDDNNGLFFERRTAVADVNVKSICSTCMSEGSQEESKASVFCGGNGVTTKALANGAFSVVMAMRAATVGQNGVSNTGQIEPLNIEILNSGISPVAYQVLFNPTLTNASFSKVAASSIAEVATAVTAYTGGIPIGCGYIPGSASVKGLTEASAYHEQPVVYAQLNGVQDTIAIVAAGVGGASAAAASITWKELW